MAHINSETWQHDVHWSFKQVKHTTCECTNLELWYKDDIIFEPYSIVHVSGACSAQTFRLNPVSGSERMWLLYYCRRPMYVTSCTDEGDEIDISLFHNVLIHGARCGLDSVHVLVHDRLVYRRSHWYTIILRNYTCWPTWPVLMYSYAMHKQCWTRKNNEFLHPNVSKIW
jgi:hypothetical protein